MTFNPERFRCDGRIAEYSGIPLPADYTESQLITIDVGGGHIWKRYNVHKDLLTATSEFFRACLMNPQMSEAQTGIVNLPDDTPDVFDVIVNWLYMWQWNREFTWPAFDQAFHAYLLAEKLMMNALKNELMDCLRQVYQRELDEKIIGDDINQDTIPAHCALHMYLADDYALRLAKVYGTVRTCEPARCASEMGYIMAAYRNAGIVDVFPRSLEHMERFHRVPMFPREYDRVGNKRRCIYHDHDDGITTPYWSGAGRSGGEPSGGDSSGDDSSGDD